MDLFTVALITFDDDTPIFDALVQEAYSNLLNVSMHVQLVKELGTK